MFCVVLTHSTDAVAITSCSVMLMRSMTSYYANAEHDAMFCVVLTHSIDADHDSTYRECSDDSSHVMSTVARFPLYASRASNPWLFSPCSVDAFGAYLET